MVFKHYPGLFIPLDKRHPKCVPVTSQAPDLGMLTGATSSKSQKTNHLTHLRKTFVWNVTPQSLHQHDNNSSTFSLWVVPCPLTLCLHVCTLTSTQKNHKILTSSFFAHLAWPQKNPIKFSSFNLMQTWDAITEHPMEDKLIKMTNSSKT